MEKKSSFEQVKKIWRFLWESDHPVSWILNIFIAYIVIKFLFFPAMGALMNTDYPMVAVVSGSMEHMIIDHKGNSPDICGNNFAETDRSLSLNEYWELCGEWYEKRNITQKHFSSFYFNEGFNKGDIIVIYNPEPKDLKVGDVIVFQSTARPEPIIHRVVSIDNQNDSYLFTTKGDHNEGAGLIDQNIPEDAVYGKGVFRIPYLGWVKIFITDTLMPLLN